MDTPFVPKKQFFVGIDSDGCAFDTMEVKHKECFIPNIIKSFHLASVSKYAREAAEFINLYSKWRGINRFPALTQALDLLTERSEVRKRGVTIPKLPSLRHWMETETRLGNPALAIAAEKTGDPELALCLEWSKNVNASVEEIVHNVPPFPNVRESLQRLHEVADIVVVSATPTEALTREWEEHGLSQYVSKICGQEVGTKKEILQMAAPYARTNVLMIGDAPGDFSAALANSVPFYPINPGHEDASWKKFYLEAISRFLDGTYAGDYEAELIAKFETYLPETPPWKH